MKKLIFEWDNYKYASRKHKDGVSFEEAQIVFYDEKAIEFEDPDHSIQEAKFIEAQNIRIQGSARATLSLTQVTRHLGNYLMEPNIIFGILNIASALLIIVISIPLVKNKIKMNHLYGIRIKKSFESEDNWYKINKYGGKQLIVWSLPMVLVGFICFFVPINDSNKDLLAFVFGVFPITLCLTVAVIKIYAYAKKI